MSALLRWPQASWCGTICEADNGLSEYRLARFQQRWGNSAFLLTNLHEYFEASLDADVI